MADDDTADDGAVHHFWRFVLALRARRDPDAEGLEDYPRLAALVERFNREAATEASAP